MPIGEKLLISVFVKKMMEDDIGPQKRIYGGEEE